MTVSSSLSEQTFDCDGSTTVFTCPFRVLEASELVGYLITIASNESVLLVNGTDFAVTGVGAANAIATTTLTYSNAYRVNFRRRTARLQSTDYRDNDPFPAESHESALDRLTHIAQEADADVARALLVPEPETGITLPTAADRAGLLLGFDDDGGPIAVAPVSGSAADLALDLASSAAASKGAGMAGFNYKNNYAAGTIGWSEKQWGLNVGWVAALDGATNDAASIQALHDFGVSLGKKFRLIFPGGVSKCNSGLTINTLFCSIEGEGCTLDFSGMTTGKALTILGNGQVELGGLRIEGNSATGSVDGVSMIGTGAGAPVSAVTLRGIAITGFGRGLVLGDHCYLCEFRNVIIADCLVTVDSIGTTNAGAAMRFYGGILVNQVLGGTLIRNTNPNLHMFMYGTVLDCDGKNVDFSAGLIELHGTLIEPADFAVVPFQLTGSTTSMRMYGGVITAGASPITAGTLVSCDSSCVNGAFFDGVRIDVITGTRYLVSGTGAANVNFEGCISANRHSLLGNKLADGSFENGAVLYGSADGTSKFADLVAITVDTGGVPATSLVTGTNLALTFSTTHARTGTKSLKCVKSAAAAAPAAFGIFRDISPEGRPSGRIYYKKPGTETGTMAISMGFYRLGFDTNGVPVILRQSLTSAANVVFTSAAVDWTEVGLYDLYVPPWATHYGISINLAAMAASSLYFDDAEINIL